MRTLGGHMQRLAWGGTASLSLLAAVFAAMWASSPAAPRRGPLESVAADGRWDFTWPEQDSFRDLPGRFNITVRTTLTTREGSGIRVLLNASESSADGGVERAACVGVSATGVEFGRVEGDHILPLGSSPLVLGPGAAHDVSIRRRGAEMAVIVDGRVAITAFEPYLSGGRVALARSGGARGEVWPVQRLAEFPEFSDDFMRTPDEPGPWTVHSGEWEIDRLKTPSMSANGFSYRGAAAKGHALASAGQASWDRYRAEVSMRGEDGEAMGLAFAFAGPERYCLFRWRASDADAKAPERELLVVEPGPGGTPIERSLANAPGGYRPGQWYRVAAILDFGRVRVLIDDHEVFRAELPELASGGVALWSSGAKGTVFDDVQVSPDGTIEESFLVKAPAGDVAQGAGASPASWRSRWQAVGGEWRDSPGGVVARARGEAKLLTGSPEWRRATVEVEVEAAGGGCGLVANYRDEGDHVAFKISGGRARLERMAGGRAVVLDEAAVGSGPRPRLRLLSDRGYLAGYVNGSLVVEGYDESSVSGRVGLWSSGGGATFQEFRAASLPHERPVPLENAIFEVDNIMGRWASDSGDWYKGKESGDALTVYWHRAPFHGDVALAMDLPRAHSIGGDAKVALGIAKSGDKPGNGYSWSLENAGAKGGPAEHGWLCRMTREGEAVADVPLDSGHEPRSIFIRRRGKYVLAGADGAALHTYRDEKPVEGTRVAFLAKNVDLEPSHTRLYGGLVHDYRFARAPSEWRVGDGVWDIANRWKCDDRWSFLVGSPRNWPNSKADEKLVVAWNKRSFPGDVVVDFYIGPRMDQSDPPKYRRYEYVRDFNVTISADGRDLSSGYTFMMGGFGNSKSAILRGSRILAEDKSMNARYPTGSMVGHQRWYRIRAERSGSKLTYRAYFMGRERVALEVEDPEPLSGDRIAIWSYDCPIVIARLRIAGSRGGAIEDPDSAPRGRVRTPYDIGDEKNKPEAGEGDPL